MPITPYRRALRRVAVLLGLVLACSVLALPARADATWTTVWRDDFNGPAGTGLDRTQWLYDLGHGYPGGAWNWGTGEVESMTDSTANVAMDGAGNLAITALRDASGNWTSGRVESQRTDFAAAPGQV
ncbi:MAG TPA: 1,3-beta-glucanase, partial [Propionibacteriaceae bacterium]|nr:1,3-beta-glucanase [Propionibacteriaceae bacterium]